MLASNTRQTAAVHCSLYSLGIVHQWITLECEEVGVSLVIWQPAVSAKHTTLSYHHLQTLVFTRVTFLQHNNSTL